MTKNVDIEKKLKKRRQNKRLILSRAPLTRVKCIHGKQFLLILSFITCCYFLPWLANKDVYTNIFAYLCGIRLISPKSAGGNALERNKERSWMKMRNEDARYGGLCCWLCWSICSFCCIRQSDQLENFLIDHTIAWRSQCNMWAPCVTNPTHGIRALLSVRLAIDSGR